MAQDDFRNARSRLVGGFSLKNGQARFLVRRLQAPNRPSQQTVDQFRRQLVRQARMAVTGEDDLLSVALQGIERVQKLFLGGPFSSKEIDVVNEEGLALAKALTEIAPFAQSPGLHKAIGEVF